MNQIYQSLWIFSGTLCVGLGVLGVFLPLLPATPFFLLAAYCYGRGSKKVYDWLINRSGCGSYIQNYQSGHGIPLKQKILTIVFLWLTVGTTIVFFVNAWWLKGLLGIVASGVTIHLLRMKTWQPKSTRVAQMSINEPVKGVQ